VPVGLQRHGYLDDRQLRRLEDAGCTVHVVAPYRWLPGADQDAVRRMIEAIIAGDLDAVTFTAGPAVEALLATGRDMGREAELVQALQDGRCRAFAVGHVTAQPLQDTGIPVTWPSRERMGALIKHVADHLDGTRESR
ncbi:MAG: uroporphyrinogen-III synthase, partial [Brachybacterium sp.]|nr:uroporphyrinogen-III synthase [Brachybacterium sp.]